MKISNLEHLTYPTNKHVENIEGGLSILTFNTEFLALGVNNSLAQVVESEFLSVSAPGSNISSGRFKLVLGAE